MIITLSHDAIAGAREYAARQSEYFATADARVAGKDTRLADDAYFVGRLGNLAFWQWLEMHGIPFDPAETSIEQKDRGDAIVGRCVFDVKTASQKWHKQLMMPLAKFLEHSHLTHFVGARRIDNARIKLHGMIDRRSLFLQGQTLEPGEWHNVTVPSLALGFGDLVPMQECIAKLREAVASQ